MTVDETMGPPWSATVRRGADGALVVGGVDVRWLAATYGTATYVLDEVDLRTRARQLRTTLQAAFAQVGAQVDLYYAGKAFLCVAVARWVHDEGLGVDTATGGELGVALYAGVPGQRIGLHGNNKSDAEIARALDAGVARIVIDAPDEVDRIADAVALRGGGRADVMVRVTTGVHAGGHEYISTSHEDQKFGLSIVPGPDGSDSPALATLRAVVARPELHLTGIHSHIGSQILDPGGFVAAVSKVLTLRAEVAQTTGVLVDEVDLGGGFGIAYLPDDVALDFERVAKDLAAAAVDAAAQLGTPLPKFSFEPGRSIVGPAGMTLYEVGTVKPVRLADGTVRTYVSVDGGMSDNIRPALYQADYHAVLASRTGAPETVQARVVGKHCESGDIVVRDVQLPADIRRGDLLAVAATGAYGRSMASTYNLVPRPPVVAVAEGSARALLRRETDADLLAFDQG
ncbi:MAG: diaminopimelate decarboxylase [Micrococcales bacterium]|nr:diaminopimelate decarboxylase [Micrococcales bacterium]